MSAPGIGSNDLLPYATPPHSCKPGRAHPPLTRARPAVIPEEWATPRPCPAPPEPPSASPAAQSRTDAMGAPGRVEVWPTPRVSPQVAPV
ncbi:hypothetical protein EAO74_22520 [Streptomyces sp. gb1(2016)]|uniref:Uncharacterized protein n=1 Tax=Streptomyces sp. gb1(2016) TaxID=1828321 RepID=A0A652KIC0_9ACTN|nr:hypothetical protein EAO74_22520 [Streptomyces sp. gb1(2016)]